MARPCRDLGRWFPRTKEAVAASKLSPFRIYIFLHTSTEKGELDREQVVRGMKHFSMNEPRITEIIVDDNRWNDPFCDSIFNVMPFLFTTHPDGLKSQAVSYLSVLSLSSIYVCLFTSAPSALSSSSDSSATTETQRIRRVQNEALTARVEAFSRNHQVCRRAPIFFTSSGVPRPVQEAAKDLVGHFLICKESKVVMRIVETEAYQEGEELYRNRFPEPPPDFRSPAGVLVSYTLPFRKQIMFITAGADDSADLVLLRTCSPVLGNREIESRVNLTPPRTQYKRNNVMAGPSKVFAALEPDLGRYNCLLRRVPSPSRGLYLLLNDPNPLIMLEGPRVLPKGTEANRRYSAMRGADRRFRFAFDCVQKLSKRSSLRRTGNQP